MRLSHVGWNLCGLTLPLGVAVLTVPLLIERLGQERFGMLALAWGLIGYAGALDLGIGRALTQTVARLRGERDLAAIPVVLGTASRITLLAGLAASAAIVLAVMAGASHLIRTTSVSEHEIQCGMLLMAIALPVQAMSATYRGLNEAWLNFRGINLLRAALGVVNFAGPWIVSLFSNELPWLVATLVFSRLIALLIYRGLALKCLSNEPETSGQVVYSSAVARSLFAFGGWVTVSSVVSPLLVQADRFVIAAMISAAAVSIYVVPYEVVVQSLVLVGAISSVMFPSLTKLMREEPEQWRAYFQTWLFRVAGMMAFVCIAMALLLPIVLPLWIKVGFHLDSVRVAQILCGGVFANALGAMFYALLHAKARADLTAKLHLVELPVFIVILLFLTNKYNVVGAAYAWTARMIFDSCVLAWLAKVELREK